MSGIESARAWHADDESLRRWIDGNAGTLLGASVEQHLVRCESCRSSVETMVAAAPLEAVWDKVLDEVELPQPGIVERMLTRLGLRPSEAMLVAAAPSMRLSWLSGLTTALLFVLIAATFGGPHGVTLFLLIAPLVPVAGVAASYGPSADPSFEVAAASPYPAMRLVLFRTVSVLATTIPVVVLASLLPVWAEVSAAWLLPALGFVALVLLAGTWVDPAYAAAAVAAIWTIAVAVWARRGEAVDALAPNMLVMYGTGTVIIVVVLIVRLRTMGVRWHMP